MEISWKIKRESKKFVKSLIFYEEASWKYIQFKRG